MTGLHIAVGASIDSSVLRRRQSTPLRLWIEGTTKPVTMRVWNETPEIVSLNPSNDQEVTTSGGSPNDVSRRVDAVSVGDFVLNYELTIGSCPCAEQLGDQAGTTSSSEGGATDRQVERRAVEHPDALQGSSRPNATSCASSPSWPRTGRARCARWPTMPRETPSGTKSGPTGSTRWRRETATT